MDTLGLVSPHKFILGASPNSRNSIISSKPFMGLPNLIRKSGNNGRQKKPGSPFAVLSLFGAPKPTKTIVSEKVVRHCFASIASSGQETYSVGVNPQLSVPPPSSHVGSPLFWISVGVGVSALFSWVANRAKKYAMERAFVNITRHMNAQNSSFNNAAFSPGSPPPFPFPPQPTSPILDNSQTFDLPAVVEDQLPSITAEEITTQPDEGPKNKAFLDVSPEEALRKNDFEKYKESITEKDSSAESKPSQPKLSLNDTASKQGKNAPVMPLEALEKLIEDPMIQKMLYPSLPHDMRNPIGLKWMIQNPEFRQQFEGMLNKVGGNPDFANILMEEMARVDFNTPEMKQAFDEMGVTPEGLMSKLMSDPRVLMGMQNPKIQAAIVDISKNPMNLAKYENDREVMDVINTMTKLLRP